MWRVPELTMSQACPNVHHDRREFVQLLLRRFLHRRPRRRPRRRTRCRCFPLPPSAFPLQSNLHRKCDPLSEFLHGLVDLLEPESFEVHNQCLRVSEHVHGFVSLLFDKTSGTRVFVATIKNIGLGEVAKEGGQARIGEHLEGQIEEGFRAEGTTTTG